MLGLNNPVHILFLLVVLLLVFGAKRLPEMGRSLGTGLRGFKETLSGEDNPAPTLPAGKSAQRIQTAAADTAAPHPSSVQSVAATGVDPTGDVR